jgi:hypothetical protein
MADLSSNVSPGTLRASTAREEQLSVVVAALKALPETINPATEAYYQLYLAYTFGTLDVGKLLLHKDEFTGALETGKAAQEDAKDMLQKLRVLPSRSSHYVPL